MSKRRCAYCREYFDQSTMIVSGLSAFCSNGHLLKARNKSRPKPQPKQPNDDFDGISPAMRLAAIEADGYRCRYCGNLSHNLAVHHIYYRSEARNEPWLHQPHNLITLCNYPCHLDIVHGNKRLYQPLCLQIVWLRMIEGDVHTTIQMLERQSYAN